MTYAARYGHIDIVKYLVEKGAKINLQDNNGYTALILAAYWGEIDKVRYLVKQGADINIQDETGKTALAIAEEREHQDIADILRAAQET